MIKLAKESDENKAPVVGLADRWATWLVLGTFYYKTMDYYGIL